MRVTHFGKYFPPERGGIESVTETIVNGMKSKSLKINVVAFTSQSTVTLRESHDNFELYRCRESLVIKSQPISLRYFLYCVLLGWRSDIIHMHHPNILSTLAVFFVSPLCRIVVHWHADISFKGVLGWLVKPLTFLLKCRASKIVYTSENYMMSSEGSIFFKKKSLVIPIGIASKSFSNFANRNEKEILFVGRLVPYKGLNILLDALKVLKEGVTVRIVGSGLQASELRKMIASVPKRHKVVFHGGVDDTELEYLFARSTVFCLPSVNRLEAFGVVLLEAMRRGCPTIAADIEGSGVPWVNSCGLNFENSNHNALAEVLDRLLGDVNLRQKIAEENFRRFSESFTDEIMCERFLNLYKDLLSCKKLI